MLCCASINIFVCFDDNFISKWSNLPGNIFLSFQLRDEKHHYLSASKTAHRDSETAELVSNS